MSLPNWNDLLPSCGRLLAMPAGQRERTAAAANEYVCTLARGISSIGTLLTWTAANGETGLSEVEVTDLGGMLEAVGSLIANLADTGTAAAMLNTRQE